MQSHPLMNHALTSNYLLGSICINSLNHLELRLDLLPSLPHNKDEPLLHRKDLVEANVDVQRVKSRRIQPTVSLTTLLVALPIAFFVERLLLHHHQTEKALICK